MSNFTSGRRLLRFAVVADSHLNPVNAGNTSPWQTNHLANPAMRWWWRRSTGSRRPSPSTWATWCTRCRIRPTMTALRISPPRCTGDCRRRSISPPATTISATSTCPATRPPAFRPTAAASTSNTSARSGRPSPKAMSVSSLSTPACSAQDCRRKTRNGSSCKAGSPRKRQPAGGCSCSRTTRRSSRRRTRKPLRQYRPRAAPPPAGAYRQRRRGGLVRRARARSS